MTETSDTTQAAGLEALEILRLMIQDHETSPAARVSAAKTLLDRYTPKEDVELKRREAEERASAIAEARCLMAELAAAEPAGLHEPIALAANSEVGTDHATDNGNR